MHRTTRIAHRRWTNVSRGGTRPPALDREMLDLVVRSILLISFVLACACAATPTPAREALSAARVEIVRTLSTPPGDADGPALVEVRVTSTRGDEHLFAPVIGAAPWQDGALVLDPDRALSLGLATGERTAIDTGVTFVPVVAPSGGHAVYARSDDGWSFSLVSRSANERVSLAEGLASVGAVHFVDEVRFVFTGGRSGGVAGLWIASTASRDLATCLTNCSLRTGQPWGDAFVPLPRDLESLAVDGDVLSYADPSGALRRVSITSGDR